MPQRKKPFSGKAKREQLKVKKSRQQYTEGFVKRNIILKNPTNNEDSKKLSVQKFSYIPNKEGRADCDRYALQFHRETNEELKANKQLAYETLQSLPENYLDIDTDDFYPKDLDFPKRPLWSYDLNKDVLEAKEIKYFNDYVNNLQEKYNFKDLGYFELNLETWRQLWRVLEMSDIVLLIVDIRFPAHMFPPSLYDYVVNTLKKDFILVLNKIDLAPAPLVVAWKHYFMEKYPELHIVMFTTLPGYNLVGTQTNRAGLQIRKRKGKFRLAAEGSQHLYDVCKTIVKNNIDISSWQTKIREEINTEYENDDKNIEIGETVEMKTVDTSYFVHEKYKNDVLTIGCLGQPNVGKSSLINSIKGKKVVSVSRTPGHTKHFQTIFLTHNVKLCDCPGLVFPSKIPKTLQVLMGSFPIAQLREPYTTVKFLAERLDLINILRIEHPENDEIWCAIDICDGWAKKRGYITAKAARLDSYRAANDILRMALDGKICLCLRPPYFIKKKDIWTTHSEVEKVKWIQAKSNENNFESYQEVYSDESDDDENVTYGGSKNVSDEDDSEEDGESNEEKSSCDDKPTTSFQGFNKFAALQNID